MTSTREPATADREHRRPPPAASPVGVSTTLGSLVVWCPDGPVTNPVELTTTDRADRRPLAASTAVWVSTMLGVLVSWRLATLKGLLAGGVGLAMTLGRRRTGVEDRLLGLGVVLPLSVCGVVGVVPAWLSQVRDLVVVP